MSGNAPDMVFEIPVFQQAEVLSSTSKAWA